MIVLYWDGYLQARTYFISVKKKKKLYICVEIDNEIRVFGSKNLVTLPVMRVAEDASEYVEEIARITKNPTIHMCLLYIRWGRGRFLGGSAARGAVDVSMWSRAWNASMRLDVKWSLDGTPSIGTLIRGKQRRVVMKTVWYTLRLNRSDSLIAKAKLDQGRAFECVAAYSASYHFLRDDDFTRFTD